MHLGDSRGCFRALHARPRNALLPARRDLGLIGARLRQTALRAKNDLTGTCSDAGHGMAKGGKAVVSRLPGATIRAMLVMALAVLPSVLVPGVSVDARQMAALVALFVGLMTVLEYNADAPSLIEFRDAPPFNSCRFAVLAAGVVLLALALRDAVAPNALTGLVAALADLSGQVMDHGPSPVALASGLLAGGAENAGWPVLRAAAGLTYGVMVIGVGASVAVLVASGWPWRGPAFNVWVNLPTFDPTAGRDVVRRLGRDAAINLALGIMLPFLVPMAVQRLAGGFSADTLLQPQTLIWTMAAWAFLPASLLLRGVAMLRVAQMVRQKRRASLLAFDEGFFAA